MHNLTRAQSLNRLISLKHRRKILSRAVWLALAGLLLVARAAICPLETAVLGSATGSKITRGIQDERYWIGKHLWRPVDHYGTGVHALSKFGINFYYDGDENQAVEQSYDASSGRYFLQSQSKPQWTYAKTIFSDGVGKLGVTKLGYSQMGGFEDDYGDPLIRLSYDWSLPGQTVDFEGPIVGFNAYSSGGLVNGVSFITNMCPCGVAEPYISYVSTQNVELTFQRSKTIYSSHTFTYSFPNLQCSMTLETTDGADISMTVSGNQMTINPLTSDLVGSHTKTLRVKLYDQNNAFLTQVDRTVSINIFGCEKRTISQLVVNDVTVELGQTVTVTLNPTTQWHSYSLDCPLSLSTPDGSDLITFSGNEMSVNTWAANKVGTHTRTVRVTMTGLGTTEFTPETRDSTFQITVIPACQLSTLQEVGSTISMSTPIYGNIYQDLEGLFTHEHAAIWPLDSCVISYKITGGDTSFMRMIAGDEAKPNVLNRMHQYTSEFNDEGTYSVNIKAWYVEYTDATPPTQEVTISAPISVTVEPHCPITSFINNPAVSTLVDIDYAINTGATYLPFEIVFEPAACNFIKSYMITVDGGAIATPYWVTVDSNSNPARVVINSNQVSDAGIYSISVHSQLNTTPGISSTVPYVFVVSISSEPCSWILFDSQTINMSFTMQDGASPTTTSFNEYTNDGGQSQCGVRQYQIVSGHTGLILSTRTLSFTTTDPADVGVHTFVLMVELQSYPQFNPVVRRFEDVTVTVTAVCVESALMQYTVPAELIHIQGRAVSTYQIPAIQDTISQAVGPDGLTYCGPRVYEHVALSSTEHTPVDSAVASFDTTDTYSIDGSLPEQWGHYQITFGVLLDFYPDFVRQDFSFTFQIVPDCETSIFSQSLSLSDFYFYRGFSDSFDFAGVYSFDLQGAYSEYCGPLEYVLDPVAPPIQSYLTYDGATTLTVAPSMTETTGTFSHVLRVQLRDFASTYLDEPLEVQIKSCTVTGQFLESNNQVAVAPARQDFSETVEYLIGSGAATDFDLSFEDFDTVEDDGCQSIYTRKYSLWVDSVDVSLSPPDWASAFDPTLPLLSIQTLDASLGGLSFTVEVKAALTGVVNRDADTKVIVNLNFLTDPCLLVTLTPLTLSDMAYTIKYGAEIEQQWFEVVTDSVGACGEVQYDISGNHPANLILLDEYEGLIEVWTQDGTHAWTDPTVRGATYTITVTASLADYQILTAQIGVSATFTLTVDSVCFDTILYSKNLGPYYYQQGNPIATQVTVGMKDSSSLSMSGNGFDLCGLRAYSLDEAMYHSIGAEGTYVIFKIFDASISNFMEGNKAFQVTITAGLKDYPQVAPVQTSVQTFVFKPCEQQSIFPIVSTLVVDYFRMDVSIGQPARTYETMPIIIEVNAFLHYHEAAALVKEDLCGPLEIRVTQGIGNAEQFNQHKEFTHFGGDGIGIVPDFIKTSMVTTDQGVCYISVTLQTDDPNAKQYQAPYYLEIAPKGFYGQLRPYWYELVVMLYVKSAEAALANIPPYFTQVEPCENLLVPIYDEGEEGPEFRVTFRGEDADNKTLFLTLIYPKDKMLYLDCPTCVGIEILPNEDFAISLDLWIRPFNKSWLWETNFVQVVLSDYMVDITLNYRVNYVPASIANQGRCVTLEELIELADDDSPMKALAIKEEEEEPPEEEPEEEVVEQKVATDIEVVVESTGFDVNNFFAEYAMLFFMGSMDVEGPHYDWVMTQLRRLVYPVPLVIKCDQLGQVEIHFSRQLLKLDTAKELAALKQHIIEKELLLLTMQESDYSGPIQVPGYYLNQTEPQSESDRRRLQASSGGASEPGISGEYVENKNFNWTISELTDRRLMLQIEWDESSEISVSDRDTILISFKEPFKFLIGSDGQRAPSDLELPPQMVKVPRQLSDLKMIEAIETTSNAVGSFMQVSSLINIALAAVAQQSLAPLWGQINALQLTVHIPLVNLVFPDVVTLFFEQLIIFVTFDVVESLQEMGLELNYSVSPTTPYNDSFERLGYDSSEPIGLLGTVNIIIGILSLQVLWFFTPDRLLCFSRCQTKRSNAEQVAASVIRFNIEMAFELIITVGAVFYPRNGLTLLNTKDRTRFDKFGIGYTAAIGFGTILFLILTTSRTLRQSRRIVRTNVRIRTLKGKQIHELSLAAEGQDAAADISLLPSDDDDFESFYVKQTAKGPHAREIRQLRLQRRKQRHKIRLYHEFYAGLNMASEWAQLYHFFYILRRLMLTLIALQLQNFASMQVLSMVGLCIVSQVFLLHARIFEDFSLYRMDVFNDFFVYLAVLHALVILVVQTDIGTQDMVGFSLVSSVLFGLAFNIGLIARSIVKAARHSCKRAYIRMTGKARHWDATTKGLKGQGCPCKCYHCGTGKSMRRSFDAAEESPFELKLISCKLARRRNMLENTLSPIQLESSPNVRQVKPDIVTQSVSKAQVKITEQQRIRRIRLIPAPMSYMTLSDLVSGQPDEGYTDLNAGVKPYSKVSAHEELERLSQFPSHPPRTTDASELDPVKMICETSSSSNSEDNEEVSQLRQQRNKTKQARAREWIETYGEDNFDQGRLVQRAKRLRIAEDPDQIDMDFFPDEEFLAIKQRQPHVVDNKRKGAVSFPMVSHLQKIEEQPGEESKRGDSVRSQIGQEIRSTYFSQYAHWHENYNNTQPRVRSFTEEQPTRNIQLTKSAPWLKENAMHGFSDMSLDLAVPGGRPRKVSFLDQSELLDSVAVPNPISNKLRLREEPPTHIASAMASFDAFVLDEQFARDKEPLEGERS